MNFLDKYNIKMNNIELLNTALTHSSYSNENNGANYERLEFLGDAVLQLIMSDYFYNNSDYDEGHMSKIRASYVCEQALVSYADEVGYVPYILVGHGQLSNINDTIVADIFEAILGAIYLDQGYMVAKSYIYKVIIPFVENGITFMIDYKSALQELTQTSKKNLTYNVVSETGPAHNKKFKVEVRIDDILFGEGVGKSKKEAEQNAAFNAYKKQAR